MSRCKECGAPQEQDTADSIRNYILAALYAISRGERVACIANLKRALELAEAFHAKCEGQSPDQKGGGR